MTFTPTVAEVERGTLATLGYIAVEDITMDSTNAYVAGGFAIPGFTAGNILGVVNLGGSTAAATYVPFWNKTTGKLMVENIATGAEFSGTFAASVILRVGVIGY